MVTMKPTEMDRVVGLWVQNDTFYLEYEDGTSRQVPMELHVELLKAGITSLTGSIDDDLRNGLIWIRDYVKSTIPEGQGIPVVAMRFIEQHIERGDV